LQRLHDAVEREEKIADRRQLQEKDGECEL